MARAAFASQRRLCVTRLAASIGLGVGRQDPQRSPTCSLDRPEVPLIQRQDIGHVVAAAEDDDRGISEAEREVSISLDDVDGLGDVDSAASEGAL